MHIMLVDKSKMCFLNMKYDLPYHLATLKLKLNLYAGKTTNVIKG
jgi:hypothetical protein